MNTGIQDVENSKPVFDPEFHTELIIKDEYEDFNSGIAETYILTIINIHELEIIYYNYKVFYKIYFFLLNIISICNGQTSCFCDFSYLKQIESFKFFRLKKYG